MERAQKFRKPNVEAEVKGGDLNTVGWDVSAQWNSLPWRRTADVGREVRRVEEEEEVRRGGKRRERLGEVDKEGERGAGGAGEGCDGWQGQ